MTKKVSLTDQRLAGILLHVSSLPSRYGIGDLGAAARSFVEWIADAGISLWQVLPLVPAGDGNSPYCSWASFGGNPLFIDLEALVQWQLLTENDIATPPLFSQSSVEFQNVAAYKMPLLQKAAKNLISNSKHPQHKAFVAYQKKQNHWLSDAALYYVLRENNKNNPWWQWPKDLRERNPVALNAARKKHAQDIAIVMALQFFFDTQWRDLKDYCAKNNVAIVGDIPIYVGGDSADVWANKELFKLKPNGTADKVAGCPPDAFSQTGQLWGNPVYDWKQHTETDFAWWVSRAKRALEHANVVRIDHFRGLAAYWEIPGQDTDARGGKWVKGPSHAFLNALKNALGGLPFIAEDLGYIDEPVIELRDNHQLPGMMILQFAFGANAANEHHPHNAERNRVMYPGTHDNETLIGWWKNLPENSRIHMRNYLGISHSDEREVAKAMMRTVLASIANHAILPMQDVLGLDNSARMNTPGTEGAHNWSWRMAPNSLGAHLAQELAMWVDMFGRKLPA
jgi:4-alpha-glucanotransferase